MSDIIKRLVDSIAPLSLTTAYTVPTRKYAVVKSAVICNQTSSDLLFTLKIGGIDIATNHLLKGYGTLILDELDIPMLATERIMISSSNNNCVMYLSGFERDYFVSEYPYLKIRTVTNTSITTLPNNDFDAMIRSIIICNGNGSGVSSNVSVQAPWHIINNKEIKARDTLLIPNLKLFLPKERGISFIGTNTAVSLAIILEKVMQ